MAWTRNDISGRTLKQNGCNRGISRMAARAGRFPGNSAAGNSAVFLAGERLGARHRISCVLVAGGFGTVERRHSFSAVGGVGEPRIWGAALRFLSAAVVDAGGGAELCGSVEGGAGVFHRHLPDDGGTLCFRAGAAISAGARGTLRSGVLCGKSVCTVECLYAQRFCGTTGVRADAGGGADGAAALRAGEESQRFPAAGDGVLRGGVRGGVAIECASRGDGELQRGDYFCVGRRCGTILAAVVARRGGIGAGLWIDEFLSFARGL